MSRYIEFWKRAVILIAILMLVSGASLTAKEKKDSPVRVAWGEGRLALKVVPANGYKLSSPPPIVIELVEAKGVTLRDKRFEIEKEFKSEGTLLVPVKIDKSLQGKQAKFKVKVSYVSCNVDSGLCSEETDQIPVRVAVSKSKAADPKKNLIPLVLKVGA